MVVSILEQISSELHNKANHVVEHLSLFVHVDGEIRLSSRQIHLFGLLEVTFGLKLLSLLNLDSAVLALGQVVNDKLVGFLPFVCANVHLECLNVLTSLNKEGLSLLVFANLSVVTCDLNLVWSDLVSWLVLDKVHCAIPVAGRKSGLNCLIEDTGLDEVVDGLVELPLRDKPVTPFFFKSHNVVRE